jgi:hypothetical protein
MCVRVIHTKCIYQENKSYCCFVILTCRVFLLLPEDLIDSGSCFSATDSGKAWLPAAAKAASLLLGIIFFLSGTLGAFDAFGASLGGDFCDVLGRLLLILLSAFFIEPKPLLGERDFIASAY